MKWPDDEHEFALCLTHDVDRPYKTFQSLYYALTERDPTHLWGLVSADRPYWQFEELMALEESLGVRSSFYFLDEQRLFADRPMSEWFGPAGWKLYLGRYDVTSPEIAAVVRELDENGWEVGLHGSYESYTDVDRLRREKATVEGVLGDRVLGGRQHYLNLSIPETWRHHAEVGLKYDATPRSVPSRSLEYNLYRPFDDEFVVFPLTLMDVTIEPTDGDLDSRWETCERALEHAFEHEHVATVCWHPRYFNEAEFPGYRELYVRLIERAQELGAWIGPCGEFYTNFLEEPHAPTRERVR